MATLSKLRKRRFQRAGYGASRWGAVLAVAVVAALLSIAAPASAGTIGVLAAGPAVLAESGFSHWWLTPNYSTHGDSIDRLFYFIFWITMAVFVAVEVTIVVFAIKYRFRADRAKAIFTHGNTRLEMAWTLAPAVVLLVIALWTKRAWDDFRFAAWADDPTREQLLVIGEQFKWNVIYPGQDRELGRYLSYPKPTDPKYRGQNLAAAMKAINNDITANPLGQDVHPDKSVPDAGRDDDTTKVPGRPVIVPVETKLDLHLTSKDVIHDFFLPNFRVKLDAVPGMRGHVFFESKREGQSTEPIELAKVPSDKAIWLDLDTPGVAVGGNPKRFQIYDPTDKSRGARRRVWLQSQESLSEGARKRLLRKRVTAAQMDQDAKLLADEIELFRADLAKLGITRLSVITKPHEIVCEELCGLGHYTMRGDLLVVSKQEYQNFINRENPAATPAPAPATQPVASAAPAGAGATGAVTPAK